MEACYGFDSTEVMVVYSWGLLLYVALLELNLESAYFEILIFYYSPVEQNCAGE